MKNANEPISPCLIEGVQGYGNNPTIPNRKVHGLTKREYFAGLAMQGLSSGDKIYFDNITQLCSESINIADELLKQLENE